MQIRELISSGSFMDLKLLTGDHGLDTHMKDVVLLEYESLKQDNPNYYQGDFIISTLYFAKDSEDTLYHTISRLISLGAAGLAFKSSYYKYLPDPVKRLAQEKSFPIFMFDHLYIEDVILTISDYLRLRQEFSMYEDPLFKILSGSTEGCNIDQFCANMNPNRQKYMNAVFVHAMDASSQWSMNLRNALQRRNTRPLVSTYRFLQFRRGFFLISNFTEPADLTTIADSVRDTLAELGCPTEQLCFGVSDLHQRSTEFDCVIREAFDAALVAIHKRIPQVLYPDLRLYQTVFPLIRDKSIRETMRQRFELLDQYDKESGTGILLGTLICHAQNSYDIKKTADALNQHPNTIRYRLKKICDLTASPLESNHALFLMGEFWKMNEMFSTIF